MSREKGKTFSQRELRPGSHLSYIWRIFMNQINQILIEGNVVRDSQVKETPRGTRVCVFPIASNRFYKDAKGEYQKETIYLDVEAWGENFSTHIARMATKGRGLRVVGRIKQDRWKTNEGKSASKYSLIAEHIDFQPQKSANENENEKSKNDAELAREGIISETVSEAIIDEAGGQAEAVF